jgi:hypothetical protein
MNTLDDIKRTINIVARRLANETLPLAFAKNKVSDMSQLITDCAARNWLFPGCEASTMWFYQMRSAYLHICRQLALVQADSTHVVTVDEVYAWLSTGYGEGYSEDYLLWILETPQYLADPEYVVPKVDPQEFLAHTEAVYRLIASAAVNNQPWRTVYYQLVSPEFQRVIRD